MKKLTNEEMTGMERGVTLFNFDGGYKMQSFYSKENTEWVDLENIPNTNLLCEKNTIEQIKKKLRKKEHRISFLGSGNYHYASTLFLTDIRRPFTLVLFDHHPDSLPSPNDSLISCGSWVLESLKKLPLLKQVIMIGISSKTLEHIPYLYRKKIKVITEEELPKMNSTYMNTLVSQIPTELVYISIDKDVLHEREALTAWDHGSMSLEQVLAFTKQLIRNKEIYGLDVCGEFPVNPANEYLKVVKAAVKKNNQANHFILTHAMDWMRRKYKTIA
ncbi:hypothetical protein D8M04_17355 [Oceanobacillus piezotolerans]|uniref:Arginase family protein n=1 Tax=Oceanobacillus piezotolerans TaxID=2448030 RepID=A0A498D546_9BACI|nr:arginase family protein [Oceanobacillus piezotolerans]RLL41291.1 hypothetical protein D8M04_17355 [Oceanobacillus piezotolerans]